MLNVLIIIGWLLAILCMLYLAKELVKDRFHARRERKVAIRNAIRTKRREQFMENRRRWAEINTGVIQSRPAAAAANIKRRHQKHDRHKWACAVHGKSRALGGYQHWCHPVAARRGGSEYRAPTKTEP